MQTIKTYYEKSICRCDLPVSKARWAELLRDPEVTTPERLETLLAFYYSSNHQNTCVGVAKRFGGSPKSHNANVMWFGRDVLSKIGDIEIRDADGSITYWPVAMVEGVPVKKGDGSFRWTLRPELVEALREYILQDALKQYSAAFAETWKREDYKWIALKTFQDNWDMDAEDFAQMLEKSFSNTKNLLVSQSTFPKLMIVSYAKQEPDQVREMFRALFDETHDVEERIKTFMDSSDKISHRLSPGKMHYQNTNTISTYLWLRYPGKYPIYKWSEIAAVCKKIGIPNPPKANGKPSEVVRSFQIKKDMTEIVRQCEEPLSSYEAALDAAPDKYFKPDGLATIVDDIGFWISRYYKPIISETSEPKIEEPVANMAAEPSEAPHEPRFWWLVASPRYWSFSDLQVGDTVQYTVKNDKGNKRRIPANFDNAQEGDFVIGYEANPVKKIVALARVVKASDGETITYRKAETLDEPISWFSFKDLDELRDMEFIKNQNGSFFRLTKAEYDVLIDLIRQENPELDDANPIKQKEDLEPYTEEQFLSEVFMTEQKLDELMQLLRVKKNVILQGAPGVGKTFSAKRLAYCMMHEKDDSRIEMVQFHQNYSYEDFIMGYRPTADGGFELRTGSFYSFCKKAEVQPGKEFFFIIDEINRGNLSKIFGELLMLVEKSYRGQSIKLAYRNELFAVPKNLYIVGMMNTADRSLAMIDYALRRRFSFHPMAPGFDTEGFKAEMERHSDPRVAKVVEAVKALNSAIAKDDSLGEGFCIGHSYFCAQPTDVPWIDHVVRYDLCPMLDEYWFDSKEKCGAEKSRLLDLLK